MLTPYRVYETLLADPYPGLAGLTRDGDDCLFVLGGATWRYDGASWTVGDRKIPAEWPKFGNLDDADKVHWQIEVVLALLAEPADAAHEKTDDAMQDRLTDEIDRRKDVEDQLARVTTERDQARQAYLDLSGNNPLRPTVNAIAERLGVCPAEPGPMLAEVDRLKGLADAHAVVSQRLVGAQREVAERDTTIDELRTALEAIAAHVGLVGSDQWALDEIRGKIAEITAALTWEGMEAIYPADLVERAKRMAIDAAQHLLDREFVAAARDARARLAAYLGMDGAGFAEIVEAIDKGSYTAKDGQGDLDPLLSRHNAPVKIGDRTLSPAERAAFVIRRLTRAAQNARAEAAALRAEQEEIAEALGDAPTYAEHADGSLVGLNLVERVRARLT